MVFWIAMLICILLMPLLMLGVGSWWKDHPPKSINVVYGYRTTMSMKNEDTWKFAHHYFGKLWRRLGLAMLPVSALAILPFLRAGEDMVGTVGGVIAAIQCAVLLISIFPTEAALRKHFDKNGNKKSSTNQSGCFVNWRRFSGKRGTEHVSYFYSGRRRDYC